MCLRKLEAEQFFAGAAYIVELVVEHATFFFIDKLLQPGLGRLLRHRDALDVLANMLEIFAAFAFPSCHYLS